MRVHSPPVTALPLFNNSVGFLTSENKFFFLRVLRHYCFLLFDNSIDFPVLIFSPNYGHNLKIYLTCSNVFGMK